MVTRCKGPIWTQDDFTLCFQRLFLQTLIPLIAVGASLLYLSIQSIRRTIKLRNASLYQYADGATNDSKAFVIRSEETVGEDGIQSIDEEDGMQSIDEEDENNRLALQKVAMQAHASLLEVSRPRGELLVPLLEIFALLGEVSINLAALLTHAWKPNGAVAAIAGLVTWSYILLLSLLRILPMYARYHPLPDLWNHTAILYGLKWLFAVITFRSAIVHPRSIIAQGLTISEFVFTSLLFLIALTTRKGNKVVIVEYEDKLEPSHEPLASLLSLATFSWVDAIVLQGYRKTLELPDVWNLALEDKAAAILGDFRQVTKASRLAWHLLKYFKYSLLAQAVWAAIAGFFTFVPTLLLKAILEYVENYERTPPNAAWFYVILLAVTTCVEAITSGQALWLGRKICIRLRAIIIGEIYAKALRRKIGAGSDTILGDAAKKAKKANKDAKHQKKLSFGHKKDTPKASTDDKKTTVKDTTDTQVNVGTIINLMAVDSFKVSEISAYLHFLWASTPVQLVVAITLLYRILGYSSIASIGVMMLVAPFNIFIAKQFSVTQKKIMAATDARIHTTNEVLQNIRIIKYFAWEQRFGQAVNEKRTIELRALRNRYILWAFAATIWAAVPILVTFLSFYIYTTVEKRALIPSVAFTALSLFSILRIPLDQLADMIARVQESKVSVDRVEEFLNEEETEKYVQLASEKKDENGETIIGLDEATLTWDGKNARTKEGSSAFQMIGMNIRFHVGRLNIIAGPTGSGKTSLLMALLGEMTLLEGTVYLPGGRSREDLSRDPETGLTESVAYCAQQAWLVNDTIKQNILFASPMDDSRYKSVIDACALERDLEILDAGDATLVGEKGITLSGGQKQRISLARALYCNSRHVLLDDCLSAVDSHTAKHIFEHCVMGPLMLDRTCILVTHNVGLCVPSSHHVVVLANGKIAIQGSPETVMSSGALGEDLLKTSRPTSKSGTKLHSRVASALQLESIMDNDANKTKGHANGSVDKSKSKLKQQDQNENANIRTEGKAEGGVKWPVIKMYLAAMGRWYFWVAAAFAFIAQQLGSVATNVWIREWANAYHTEQAGNMITQLTVNYVRGNTNIYPVSCLSSGTCAWNLPLRFGLPSNGTLMESFGVKQTAKVNVIYYLGIYALIGSLYLLVLLFREAMLFLGSINASRTLHERLLESVSRAKFSFFDSTPLGQLMNRFSKDIETIDQEVAPIAMGVLNCMASITTIVILISIITPAFLIAGVFITAIYFAIGKFYIRSSRDLKRLESVQRSPLYQQFGETLSGISTIRAYGDERRFIRDNQIRVNTHSRPFIYLWAANRWLALRVDFTGALVSFFAGVFVIISVGKIDAGAAGLSLTYAVTFTENVLWLVRLYANNEQNMNSVERVKEYMDVEQEAKAVIPENRPPGNWPSHGAIEFIDYSTRYRSDLDPVLRHVTFNVQPGERVGIVGRTGAGKSSLALALFRGLEAEDGKILIDNIDIGLVGLQDLRESITIVPQDPTLFTGTIRNNLDPFGLFTDEEIFAVLQRVQLIDTSTSASPSKSKTPDSSTSSVPTPLTSPSSSDVTFNAEQGEITKILTNTRENTNVFKTLSSPIAESGSNLSQGQRQLLCLARALLKAPRVLLMDEATASIDYATDAKIQDTLREVKDSTIITIAHRLQTIIDYDKVLVLDKGEVIEFNSPWELIEKDEGVFKGMCEMSGDMDGLVQEARKAGAKRKLVDV